VISLQHGWRARNGKGRKSEENVMDFEMKRKRLDERENMA